MIQNENPIIADSLWSATASAHPVCAPLRGAAETQVAVIGAGFTGLSAALHLAKAGHEVSVLEAETPGWGASGRNGGQVNPGLIEDPDAVIRAFGESMGGRMVALSGEAGQLVFSLIEKHHMDCEAMPVGWIRAAHNAKAMALMRSRAEQWQRHGTELRLLSREETAEMIGAPAYVGGLLDPRGGNVHPLNYALGLAKAALEAGAYIHGQSRALSREKRGDRWVITTPSGQLAARRVLICTNAYSGDFAPDIVKTVVPVRSVQVATKPLSGNVYRSILPGRHASADTRRLLLYYRKDGSGRFIMGGRGGLSNKGTLAALEDLRRQSVALYPQLAGAEWEHGWGGNFAATSDHYPRLHEIDNGVMAGLGFNGRGVAMATAMGKVLAQWAAGRPPAELDFPVTPPRSIPFHGFSRIGVQAAMTKMKLLDRLGL